MGARLSLQRVTAELVNVSEDSVELILILHRLLLREGEA
jgi:hypothetical protein